MRPQRSSVVMRLLRPDVLAPTHQSDCRRSRRYNPCTLRASVTSLSAAFGALCSLLQLKASSQPWSHLLHHVSQPRQRPARELPSTPPPPHHTNVLAAFAQPTHQSERQLPGHFKPTCLIRLQIWNAGLLDLLPSHAVVRCKRLQQSPSAADQSASASRHGRGRAGLRRYWMEFHQRCCPTVLPPEHGSIPPSSRSFTSCLQRHCALAGITDRAGALVYGCMS